MTLRDAPDPTSEKSDREDDLTSLPMSEVEKRLGTSRHDVDARVIGGGWQGGRSHAPETDTSGAVILARARNQ